jgi:hypothetical protein
MILADCHGNMWLRAVAWQWIFPDFRLHVTLFSPCRDYTLHYTYCGIAYVWRHNHLLNVYTIIYCHYAEYTDELQLKKCGLHIASYRKFFGWIWVLSLSLILWPTVSRPVYHGIKHPSGAYDEIFITVRQLRVCWYWVLSLTSGLVTRS